MERRTPAPSVRLQRTLPHPPQPRRREATQNWCGSKIDGSKAQWIFTRKTGSASHLFWELTLKESELFPKGQKGWNPLGRNPRATKRGSNLGYPDKWKGRQKLAICPSCSILRHTQSRSYETKRPAALPKLNLTKGVVFWIKLESHLHGMQKQIGPSVSRTTTLNSPRGQFELFSSIALFSSERAVFHRLFDGFLKRCGSLIKPCSSLPPPRVKSKIRYHRMFHTQPTLKHNLWV